MKRLLSMVMVVMSACELCAARHVGFQTDAFNRAYPASYTKSMVFSPYSFEIDSAIIAESLETIPKANVSETMGIVLDFESTLRPIIETFDNRTNGLSVVAARGFCVGDLKDCSPEFRQYLERTYGAEVMRFFPRAGAESWFRAAMEGEMENFELPDENTLAGRYSFYDLISVFPEWEEPFPTANSRTFAFHPDDSTNVVPVACMSDVRMAEIWENPDFTLLKLPLRGGASFYAMLPSPGSDLLSARLSLSSREIDRLLVVTKSLTEDGVYHGPCVVVLPKLDLFSRTNFSAVLTYFRIPATGLVHIADGAAAREHVQYTRFRLAEHGKLETPLIDKPEDQVIPIGPTVKKMIFNRPFLFFVYHESSACILVAGQFFGR